MTYMSMNDKNNVKHIFLKIEVWYIVHEVRAHTWTVETL